MAHEKVMVRHPLSFCILHGIILASIFVLIVTGFYIHRPFIGGGGFLMAGFRGAHLFFASILMMAITARLISMFIGPDRDWRSFILTPSDFALLPRTIGYYLFICKEPQIKKKYNPLQMLAYDLIFIMIIFQIISGLALLWPENFGWFNYTWLENEIETRIAHLITHWLFIIFLTIHIYLVIRDSFPEVRRMFLFREGR